MDHSVELHKPSPSENTHVIPPRKQKETPRVQNPLGALPNLMCMSGILSFSPLFFPTPSYPHFLFCSPDFPGFLDAPGQVGVW